MEVNGTRTLKSILDVEGYNYRINKDDIGTQLNISKGYLIILKTYREQKNKTMTTLLHAFLGLGIKCYEEKHDEKIIELNELREKLRAAELIMALYHKKYGPLHVKKGVRDSIIKPQEDSLNKPSS